MKRSGRVRHQFHQIGQLDQVGLVDLDQAQAALGEFVQAGLDQRALAGAARTGEQHVVRGPAADKLLGVAAQPLHLRVDLLQVAQPDRRHMPHRLELGAGTAAAVAKGDRGVPVGRPRRMRQHSLQTGQQTLGVIDQVFESLIHRAQCRVRPDVSRPTAGRRTPAERPAHAARGCHHTSCTRCSAIANTRSPGSRGSACEPVNSPKAGTTPTRAPK